MTAMILYNLWQAINLMLTTTDQEGAKKKTTAAEDQEQEERGGEGYRVTMPFMVTIFCAHLNGRI